MKTVKDLLDDKGYKLFSLAPHDTVYDAIKAMAERSVGALVVLDGTKKLAGILSERDYARKVILQGRRSQDTPVSDIMTTKVICVNRERTIDECMALMTERRIRHLPVIEENEVIGIISIGDVVRAVIQEKQFLIEQLERYITSG
jgi:signal-transduction protein with cAMP-binding, CBS, and nucleotidyltransferase domain